MQLHHQVNVFFGEPGHKNSFTVQQGEYNSRDVMCTLYQKIPGDKRVPFKIENKIITVVYEYGTRTSPEYETKSTGENSVSFTIPKDVADGQGKAEFQLFVYSEGALLKSATVPFKVLKSINPSSTGVPDAEPFMLTLIAQTQELFERAQTEEQKRIENELERERIFAEWQKLVDEWESKDALVINASAHYDFPSYGNVNAIYKAESERKLYQWNENELRYELLNASSSSGEGDLLDIELIYGGDANGTD